MAEFDLDLTGIVAVVTGASRGAGRGVALVLGGGGATVYVTGRSVGGVTSGPGRQGTIDDTAKAATARMAFGMAEDLRRHRVAAVALAPGHLGATETTEYLGRAVATLAADTGVMAKTGLQLTVGELAREYGFTDIDGTQPEPFGLPNPQ